MSQIIGIYDIREQQTERKKLVYNQEMIKKSSKKIKAIEYFQKLLFYYNINPELNQINTQRIQMILDELKLCSYDINHSILDRLKDEEITRFDEEFQKFVIKYGKLQRIGDNEYVLMDTKYDNVIRTN